MTTSNLKWLSSDQALADIAYFIATMNQQYGFVQPRWITFGGSYAGSFTVVRQFVKSVYVSGALSAWSRLKYPHLITGSIASSGPVQAQLNFPEYLKVVSNSFSAYDPECVSTLKSAILKMQSLLKTTVGQQKLKHWLRLCTKIDPEDQLSTINLYETIADKFSDVVQYNQVNRGIHHEILTIDRICDIMTNKSIVDPVIRMGKAIQYYLDSYNEPCLEYDYGQMIKHLKNVTFQNEDSCKFSLILQTSQNKITLCTS
ncbi:unnamed protein product [Soboliphyme baturini]|uniref:Serine protease K12H4.7 n=1 Tax=Soboliphyme baturini TaxID=241478 RepID=A0A183IRS0_9BILA|nr:unnamed protein product [Soboliphyme baturini]